MSASKVVARGTGSAVLLMLSCGAWAAETACHDPWIAQFSGATVYLDDRDIGGDSGTGVRLGIGKRNCSAPSGHSHWELNVSANTVDGAPRQSNDQVAVTLDRLRLYGDGPWQPFWQTGVGAIRDYGRDGEAGWYPALQGGGGVTYELARRGATLRADVLVQGVWNDDAVAGEPFHPDVRIAIGVMLPLRYR